MVMISESFIILILVADLLCNNMNSICLPFQIALVINSCFQADISVAVHSPSVLGNGLIQLSHQVCQFALWLDPLMIDIGGCHVENNLPLLEHRYMEQHSGCIFLFWIKSDVQVPYFSIQS